MSLKLQKKRYNSKIKIYYYKNNLNYAFSEEIIDYFSNEGQQRFNEHFELIKKDKAAVYKVEFDNQVYYLKSYVHHRISKILKNFFRNVEGVRCFKTGIKLMDAGIMAAEPVLGLTRRRNLFIVDSIFVTKEVQGVDLWTYISGNNKSDHDLREKTVKQLAFVWNRLVKHRILHQDPGFHNFFVNGQRDDFLIELIDFDNIYPLPFPIPKRLLLKNFERLKRRLENDLSAMGMKLLSHDEINAFFEGIIKMQ